MQRFALTLTTLLAALTLSATAFGQPTFEQEILSTQVISYQRQVGDLDGDGLGDVVGIDDTTLHWYAAPGFTLGTLLTLSGSVHGYPLFRADDLQLVDVDGDGDLDAVTRIGDSGNVNGEVVWLENPRPASDVHGTWTLHAVGDAEYVKDIVIADFDGDGKPDVAAREHTVSHVWLQDGADAWTARTLSHHSNEGAAVGDLDADGDPDLVLNGFWLATPSDPRTGTFTEHEIDDRWYSGQTGTWQINSSKVQVADVDGDGRLDVLLSHSELPGYPVSWYSSTDPAGGAWTEHVVTPSYDLCHTLQAADFDGDGHIDVLAGAMADSDDRGLTLYLGDGGATWSADPIQNLGSYSAEVGDVDGDGDLDIVDIRNHDEAPTEIRFNESSRPVAVEPAPAVVGDLRAAPNPFNPSTTLRFELADAGPTAVLIHDARGRTVRVLLDGVLSAGAQSVTWDGRGDDGRALPSGAYFAEVRRGDLRTVHGLSLVR